MREAKVTNLSNEDILSMAVVENELSGDDIVLLNDKNRNLAHELFNSLDTGKNNRISTKEFRLLFPKLSLRECKIFFRYADKSNSGILDFEEFSIFMLHYYKYLSLKRIVDQKGKKNKREELSKLLSALILHTKHHTVHEHNIEMEQKFSFNTNHDNDHLNKKINIKLPKANLNMLSNTDQKIIEMQPLDKNITTTTTTASLA